LYYIPNQTRKRKLRDEIEGIALYLGRKPKPMEGGGWSIEWEYGGRKMVDYYYCPWIVVG